MIPLYANGTPFEFRTLGQDPADHAFVQRAHPAGKFPILVDGDRTVIEATAIVEHLALHHPGDAPLIPGDASRAATMRMLDRVFDNYVMTNVQRVVVAYMRNPGRADPTEVASGKQGLERSYRWLETWLGTNAVPQHVSLFTCAAAPSLFYADWVEPIPETCPRVAALRADLLAVPSVSECVEQARPYRHLFPPGAPDRD